MIAAPWQAQLAILGANALRRRLAAAALDEGRAPPVAPALRADAVAVCPPNSLDVSGKDGRQP